MDGDASVTDRSGTPAQGHVLRLLALLCARWLERLSIQLQMTWKDSVEPSTVINGGLRRTDNSSKDAHCMYLHPSTSRKAERAQRCALESRQDLGRSLSAEFRCLWNLQLELSITIWQSVEGQKRLGDVGADHFRQKTDQTILNIQILHSRYLSAIT